MFRRDRIPRDADGTVANAFRSAPDWTIEILSPKQSMSKVTLKILFCLEHGTEMAWLIDPEESLIFTYNSDKQAQFFEAVDAIVPVPAFAESVQLRLGEIFGWLVEIGINVHGFKHPIVNESDAMPPRTSETHPLFVAWMPHETVNLPGHLGLTFAPGKHAPSMFGDPWQRNLDTDLQRLITVYHADCLISLLEEWEYEALKIPNLRQRAIALGLTVLHLPIPDGQTPSNPQRFEATVYNAIAQLQAGKTVVVHCRGGLGRAGTTTAAILVYLGRSPLDAMQAIRSVRPGAIENADQEDFLMEWER